METSTFPPLPLHHWEILYQRNPRAQIQASARRHITLSAQGVHDQSDPNAGPRELAGNSADSQIPKSQSSTTGQNLTASGVMSNGDSPDPTIQIIPVSNTEPQLAPDVAGTPTATIVGPPTPSTEPHGGHAPRPPERRQGNVPSTQTGFPQRDYFLSPGAIVWRPLQYPDERSQLSAPHDVIWTGGHPHRYAPKPLMIPE